LWDASEEGEGPVVTVQPSLGRRRRVGRYETSIAVREIHDKKMRPPFNAGDERIRLAEVRLGMARRMHQRHKHLPSPTSILTHVVLHNRVAAVKPVLVPQPHEDPLRCVALLAMARAVLIQILVDDPDIRIQLWSLRPFPAAITRGLRMPKHLPHRLSSYTKPPGGLSLAQAFNMTRQPYA